MFRFRALSSGRRAAWSVALCLAAVGARASAATSEIDVRLGQIQTALRSDDEQLRLVEQGFVAHLQTGGDEGLQERYGEAEVAFLIEDYGKSASLLYDVVLSPSFHDNPHYFDGVYYLGESLKRQKDFLGAKHFLREVMEHGPATPHFAEALISYLEVAARTNDFRDLDRYTDLAEHSGRFEPAVQYLLAKATFERTDLPTQDRVERALRQFSRIPSTSPFYLQALYFDGVCLVQTGHLPEARDAFAHVATAAAPNDPSQRQVRELANLAIGRIEYELGHFGEALDAYQNIPESSPEFYDALYEIAWTYVKKGDYESARKAVELLTLGAPEGSLLPEANLLRGQLLLKLGKYEDSEGTYEEVVAKYGPVRDQIDQLLAVNGDPAAYFDRLLAQKGGSFDVTSLLPAPARSWATSQRGVKEAQVVARDLGDGRQGIADSDAIVTRLRARMSDVGSLEAFPALQAGRERAGTVDSALLLADTQLVAVDEQILASVLTPGEQAELRELARSRVDLESRFGNLPKSTGQLQGREALRTQILKDKEKEVFKLSLMVQSIRAQATAVQKLADETRPQRIVHPADEAKFGDDVRGILNDSDGYDAQIGALTKDLRDEQIVSAGSGNQRDEVLRATYATALQREADILSQARQRAGSPAAEQAQTVQTLREQVAQLRARTSNAIDQIRQAAIAQAAVILQKVELENRSLDEYRRDVAAAEGDASGLVGRIAFESFKRVRRQAYDLVLKADVGIIDVAWTRKRDDADKIQKLASDKDREVRSLDEDFHEVLEEVH